MSIFFYKNYKINKSLNDYCNYSTIKSIQNIIENKKKYEIIEYKEKLKYNPFYNLQKMIHNSNINPNLNNKTPYILLFIFIPSIIYFYYRKETR
jgi:hypothetical protein